MLFIDSYIYDSSKNYCRLENLRLGSRTSRNSPTQTIHDDDTSSEDTSGTFSDTSSMGSDT